MILSIIGAGKDVVAEGFAVRARYCSAGCHSAWPGYTGRSTRAPPGIYLPGWMPGTRLSTSPVFYRANAVWLLLKLRKQRYLYFFDKRSGLPWFPACRCYRYPDSVFALPCRLISRWVSWPGASSISDNSLDAYPTELSLIVYFAGRQSDNKTPSRFVEACIFSPLTVIVTPVIDCPVAASVTLPPWFPCWAKPDSEAINTTTKVRIRLMHANFDAKRRL